MKSLSLIKSRPRPDGAAFLWPILLISLLVAGAFFASITQAGTPPDRPKLVVGIVIDQMRYDFLYRYWKYYGDGGFKRLVTQGYSFEQALYPYAPTVTGPGHASIYTGTTPAWHGIAGNHWLDRSTGKEVYCASSPDSLVKGLGSSNAMSPQRLLSTTLGDELKYATRGRSKVIGIALKDRGAVLPAGLRGDAAYWFDSKKGKWVSSTYYFTSLPPWVESYNQSNSVQAYANQPWAPLLPNILYEEGAGPDSSEFEGQLTSGAGGRMPVDLPKLFKGGYEIVASSALGSAVTTDFALEALRAEQLGMRGETDLLCLSYSSPDLVGHVFGPDSWECMDAYVRLDKQIERLLGQLDQTVGLKNSLIFLTADHGVVQIPGVASKQKMPSGRYSEADLLKVANARLAERYGSDVTLLNAQGDQLYLNRAILREKKISLDEAAAVVADAIRSLDFVQNAWPSWGLKAAAVTDPFALRLAMGCHPERSGDVFLQAKSGYIESNRTQGTTHGSAYLYDTHVPMLFFGWGVQPGETVETVSITDIAPTVAAMLKIQMPSATTGKARAVTRKRK
jgi:predicted AlkP superfamily pyrophosphatase or phosphodiesterase